MTAPKTLHPGGNVQRRLAVRVLDVWLGTVEQQEREEAIIARPHGHMQGCTPRIRPHPLACAVLPCHRRRGSGVEGWGWGEAGDLTGIAVVVEIVERRACCCRLQRAREVTRPRSRLQCLSARPTRTPKTARKSMRTNVSS